MNAKLLTVSLLVVAGSAQADFIPPDGFGWTRGSVNSTYGEWNVFTAAAGPNLPDVGMFNPTAIPFNVWDSAGGSIITASGNIYSFTLPLNIHITAPSYAIAAPAQTRVILQVRTVGTEINGSSVNIGGVLPVQSTELARVSLGPGGPGGGGFMVDMLYEFRLSGNAASYEIRFNATDNYLSLDRVSVDTFTGPAPECYANCDGSVTPPILSPNDFVCFLNNFASGASYANCDESTGTPALSANDFVCYLNRYAAGCM
jgi:hypothetical protein